MAEQKIVIQKITVFGETGAGKSSILNALKGLMNLFGKHPSTIGVDYYIHNTTRKLPKYPGYEFECNQQIWDTAGRERFRSIAETYFRNTDSFIFVVDGTESLDKEKAKSWLNAAKSSSPDAKFYFAINKCDSDFQNEEALKKIAINKEALEEIATELDIKVETVVTCSAKDGTNIPGLFEKVRDDYLAELDLENEIQVQAERRSRSFMHQKIIGVKEETSPPWSTFKKILVGNAVVGAATAVTLFTLAAFAVGSFLTFGILPSAFIGAAIITAAALAVWNIGYGIYNWYSNRESKELDRRFLSELSDSPPQTNVPITTLTSDRTKTVEINVSPLSVPKKQTDPKSEGSKVPSVTPTKTLTPREDQDEE